MDYKKGSTDTEGCQVLALSYSLSPSHSARVFLKCLLLHNMPCLCQCYLNNHPFVASKQGWPCPAISWLCPSPADSCGAQTHSYIPVPCPLEDGHPVRRALGWPTRTSFCSSSSCVASGFAKSGKYLFYGFLLSRSRPPESLSFISLHHQLPTHFKFN